MNRSSLFTQLVMIIVAVVVGIMYINPTVTKIKTTQDSNDLYKQELTKISAVNDLLSAHVMKIDSVPLQSKQALLTYVPDSIDELIVMRDLQAILAASNIEASTLVFDGDGESDGNTSTNGSNNEEIAVEFSPYTRYTFTVDFETTYEQLKNFFGLIETNNYLLEISSLEINPAESGLLSVKISLTAFSRKIEDAPLDGTDFISEDMTE